MSTKFTSGDAPADLQQLKALVEYARVREEFVRVASIGPAADIDSAMLNVDDLIDAIIARIDTAASGATASGNELSNERIIEICKKEGLGPCLGLAVGRAIEREVRATVSAATKPTADPELHNRITQRLTWLENGAGINVPEFVADVRSLLATKPSAPADEQAQAAPLEHPDKIAAKITVKLRADSGYMADQEARISANQWGKICAILAGKDAAPMASTDAVIEAREQALEEAAKLCEEMEGDMFDQYKGRGKHAPNNPYRADPYMNGQSDGAGQCANAIRAMMSAPAATHTTEGGSNG